MLVLMFALVWTLEAREAAADILAHLLDNGGLLVLVALDATMDSMSVLTSIDLQFMQTDFGRVWIIAEGASACGAQRLVS